MDISTISEVLEFELLNVDGYSLKVYTFVIIILILIVTRLLISLLDKIFFRKNEKKWDLRTANPSNKESIYQHTTT